MHRMNRATFIRSFCLGGVLFLVIFLFASEGFPFTQYAVGDEDVSTSQLALTGGVVTPPGGGVVTPPGGGVVTPDAALRNPLQSKSIEEFLLKIIEIILVFAVPVIVFFIIYGGFLLVTARGDEGQVTTGRNTITWAVIGGVIVLGAQLIITVIQGTVASL